MFKKQTVVSQLKILLLVRVFSGIILLLNKARNVRGTAAQMFLVT